MSKLAWSPSIFQLLKSSAIVDLARILPRPNTNIFKGSHFDAWQITTWNTKIGAEDGHTCIHHIQELQLPRVDRVMKVTVCINESETS